MSRPNSPQATPFGKRFDALAIAEAESTRTVRPTRLEKLEPASGEWIKMAEYDAFAPRESWQRMADALGGHVRVIGKGSMLKAAYAEGWQLHLEDAPAYWEQAIREAANSNGEREAVGAE
jgi:hypothetical protein